MNELNKFKIDCIRLLLKVAKESDQECEFLEVAKGRLESVISDLEEPSEDVHLPNNEDLGD